MKKFKELQENLRKDIAKLSSKFPEGSKVRCKKSGKTGKVLTVGKDFVKVAVDGGKDVDYKPTEIEPLKELVVTETPSEEKPMMAGQLKAIHHFATGIEAYIATTPDPEEWFQNKLAKAYGELQSLYSYTKGEVND